MTMTTNALRLGAFALALALPATAQDRQGNDTPGDWIVDHTKHFGLWDSMCDHRMTGEEREQRCYIRYVDVFSPRPKFGAVFLFVTPGPEVQIGLEPGTVFPPNGIRIDRNPIGTLVLARPRISHILLAPGSERFRCNVAVPRGKVAPPGTTALRSEHPEAMVAGLNKRRATMPEGARWAGVLGAIGVVTALLLTTVLLQLPGDLFVAWGAWIAGAVVVLGGGGVVSLGLIPLSLWS